jgi:hypothetical protein
VVRYFLLLLVAVGGSVSILDAKAGPHAGPPRHGSSGGGADSHGRPYYYRRYYYAPTYRPPGRPGRPHR